MGGDAPPFLGVVCGLVSEAALLIDQPVLVRAVAGNAGRAAEEVRALARDGAAGIVSFGLAGALSPDLRPGDVVIADQVTAEAKTGEIEKVPISNRLRQALSGTLPLARIATIAGSDEPILTAGGKEKLAREFGAIAVDMESHAAGRAARDLGIPFAVLRAVADPADRAIPPLAMTALHSDGTTSAWPVIKGVCRRPWLLPAMMQLGGDSKRAHAALARAVAAGAVDAALRKLTDLKKPGANAAPHPSTGSG